MKETTYKPYTLMKEEDMIECVNSFITFLNAENVSTDSCFEVKSLCNTLSKRKYQNLILFAQTKLDFS